MSDTELIDAQEADAAMVDAFPGSRVNAFGHAGDGNIHYNVIVPREAEGARSTCGSTTSWCGMAAALRPSMALASTE